MKRKHEISENQQRTGATKLFSMDATLNELGDEHNNRSVKHTNQSRERKKKQTFNRFPKDNANNRRKNRKLLANQIATHKTDKQDMIKKWLAEQIVVSIFDISCLFTHVSRRMVLHIKKANQMRR